MLSRKASSAIIILVLMSSSFFISSIPAQDTEIENRVAATFTIDVETGTDLKVSVVLDVEKITVFDTEYDSSEIQTIATSNPEVLGAIKLRLRDLAKTQLKATFENAVVLAVNQIPSYSNNEFHDEFNITLTSAFFGLNESINISAFVNGILDMDGVIKYIIPFQAEAGWNNTYSFVLPDSMTFKNTTGSVNGKIITWYVKNWNGLVPSKQGWLSLRYVSPTTPKADNRDVSLEFEVDSSVVNANIFTATILANSIGIGRYNILPDFVSDLDVIPSDGVRLLIDNGLLSWDALYTTTLKPIEQTTKSVVEGSSLNQILDLTFAWDAETTTNCTTPYNITNMDNLPPIKASLVDEDIDLLICGIKSRAVFGLAHAGAVTNISAFDINFGDNLDAIGYPYVGFLKLPSNIYLDGNNTYPWNASSPISGLLLSGTPKSYSDEKKTMLIDIEIKKMDLNLPSVFTGKTELTASAYIEEDINLYVTTIPNEFTLPEKIELTYLNSDAFRLCVEENVFDENSTDDFLKYKRQLFENRTSDVLNGVDVSGHIDREAFTNSLAWDGDISSMDDLVPIIVSSNADCLYSVSSNVSLMPPSFGISDQTFSLKGLADRSVTYRIAFPNGITVEADDTLGKNIVRGETEKGQQYIEIAFSANETQNVDVVTCKLTPSTLYVIGLFLPCIISIVLGVILVILIYILRKKSKGKRGIISKEEEPDDFTGYEGEDFYVPPPPPSKR